MHIRQLIAFQRLLHPFRMAGSYPTLLQYSNFIILFVLFVLFVLLASGISQAQTSQTSPPPPLPNPDLLLKAAREGNMEKVRTILDTHPELLNAYDQERNRTALHWAAIYDRKPVVELLVSRGADVNRKDDENKTPLSLAGENNHPDIVEILRKSGVGKNDEYEYPIPDNAQIVQGMHFTGIPPTPPSVVYKTAFIIAFFLLAAIGFLQWFLNRKVKKVGRLSENTIKSFFIVFLVVFYFTALEGLLQVYVHYHPYCRYLPDPILHWKENPAVPNKLTEIDSGEFVDFDFDRKLTDKKENTFRIICLGDSQTNGLPWAGKSELTYPKQLEHKLQERYPGKKIEVINMGVAGYTSYQGIVYLRKVGLKYKPDMVIAAFGNHDGSGASAPDNEVSRENDFDTGFRRLLYRSQLYLLIRKKVLERKSVAVNKENAPVFRRVSIGDYNRNLQNIIDLGKRRNYSTVLLILPNQSNRMVANQEYADITGKIADRNGVRFIDCRDLMRATSQKEKERLFQPDKCHFTMEGNGKIADFILVKLEPLLNEKLSSK